MVGGFAMRLGLVSVSVMLLLGAAGCGGSSGGGSTSTSAPATSVTASTVATTSTATTTTTTTTSSDNGLSGKWTGTYSGTYSGTFKLTWQQNDAKLSGTIDLSQGGTSTVNGTVTGSSIKFGTVGGGAAITYTGTVAGDSMSGSYSTPNGGGTWSAHRS